MNIRRHDGMPPSSPRPSAASGSDATFHLLRGARCVQSLLLHSRQLNPKRALYLGDLRVLGYGLAILVLIYGLWLHVELLRQLLLRQALGHPRLLDRLLEFLGHLRML